MFPTETVYGLGANSLDRAAVTSIYQAKGRPADNPLIVHIHHPAQINELAVNIPQVAFVLLEKLSPGPLTLVLDRHPQIPDIVSAGLDTIAVRIPSHPVALELLKQSGVPVAAPSANISGRPSPTDFQMAREYMEGRVAAIIDGGPCHIGLESTVVLCKQDRLIILRPGQITREVLQQVSGLPADFLDESVQEQHSKASPGTRHPHYRPRARVILLPQDSSLWDEALRGVDTASLGLLCLDKDVSEARASQVISFPDVDTYAREYYRSLQTLDSRNIQVIACTAVSDDGVGHALMNRMRRSAGLQ